MRAEEAAPATPLVDRYHLCFALGKAFEDRGEYEESWHYYERGNALKTLRKPLPARDHRDQHAQADRDLHARVLRQARGLSAPQSADPIFIFGLAARRLDPARANPRLAFARSRARRSSADIPRMVLELQGRDPDLDNPRYPGVLADMKPEDFLRLGEKYLADTRVYRTDKPYFIDKMPNNFRHIGLIHLMLPNAKIIDARREPMACCFSNLKQLFANGQEFTYSIEDIARYYRTYLDLMQHWDAVLPGKVLRVRHEDVVEDLEGNVRRILDFCGLEFEPACVEFHKTERSVRTASSEQVRQPIYPRGSRSVEELRALARPAQGRAGRRAASATALRASSRVCEPPREPRARAPATRSATESITRSAPAASSAWRGDRDAALRARTAAAPATPRATGRAHCPTPPRP